MSFYKNQRSISFMQNKCAIFFLLATFVYSQPSLEIKVKTLFIQIENPTSTVSMQMAINQLIRLGPKILPLIEKRRIKHPKNPHYFYILQKLKKQESNPLDVKLWQKENYFLQKFFFARKLFKKKKIKEAEKLLKAILTLEPNIHFISRVKDFLRTIRNSRHAKRVFNTNSTTAYKLHSFSKEIEITLSLYNRTGESIVLNTEGKNIILEISYTDFLPGKGVRSNSKTEFLNIDKNFTIVSGGSWEAILSIPNPPYSQLCYRRFKIKAKIPLVTIEQGGRKHYSHVLYPLCKVKMLPKKYHHLNVRSFAKFKNALQTSNPYDLFFSSFGITQNYHKQIISLLISLLKSKDQAMLAVMEGILRRFTKENKSNPEEWRNWWIARKELFEPIFEFEDD